MSDVHSFAAVSTPSCHTLILGSMPGRASLEAQQYYAHPRNAFWQILDRLLGVDSSLPYHQRIEELNNRGIAVWDVLRSCARATSLDSDIVESSIVPNDFNGFYQVHPKIADVYFNGAKAEATYRKHVLPLLSPEHASLSYTRLPSTSPANATFTLDAKIQAWRATTRRVQP